MYIAPDLIPRSEREIKTELDQLAAKGINFQNVCLIYGYEWRASSLPGTRLILEQCQEDGIPARILLRYSPLKFECTSSVGKSGADKGALTICRSEEVSSSEWPIAIFVDYRGNDNPKSYPDYTRYDYRARSRATAELIEISVIRSSASRKFYRSLSDSSATNGTIFPIFYQYCLLVRCFRLLDDYMATRISYKSSEVRQLRNMADSVTLLANLAY